VRTINGTLARRRSSGPSDSRPRRDGGFVFKLMLQGAEPFKDFFRGHCSITVKKKLSLASNRSF
jgi:hypothetical protein